MIAPYLANNLYLDIIHISHLFLVKDYYVKIIKDIICLFEFNRLLVKKLILIPYIEL